mgnify:CR=1 FL=1|jgi:hypothetical protein
MVSKKRKKTKKRKKLSKKDREEFRRIRKESKQIEKDYYKYDPIQQKMRRDKVWLIFIVAILLGMMIFQ